MPPHGAPVVSGAVAAAQRGAGRGEAVPFLPLLPARLADQHSDQSGTGRPPVRRQSPGYYDCGLLREGNTELLLAYARM